MWIPPQAIHTVEDVRSHVRVEVPATVVRANVHQAKASVEVRVSISKPTTTIAESAGLPALQIKLVSLELVFANRTKWFVREHVRIFKPAPSIVEVAVSLAPARKLAALDSAPAPKRTTFVALVEGERLVSTSSRIQAIAVNATTSVAVVPLVYLVCVDSSGWLLWTEVLTVHPEGTQSMML